MKFPGSSPPLKARMFQGGENFKNRYKVYISTTNGRAHREIVHISEKLGRNTHPQRKGVGVLSNEEEHSKEVT